MSRSESRRRRDELEGVRSRLAANPRSDSPSMLLMKRALDRQIHESQLADRGLLDIVLDGRPIANDAINVDFLARFLASLQYATTSVGQAVAGEPTRRGIIPADIRQATALSVAATFAGSFGLHITAAETAPSGD